MAVSEDLSCPLVIPVVDDVLHDVGIAPLWNGRKEVAADDLATVGHASALEQRGGPGGHVWKIEEDAAQKIPLIGDLDMNLVPEEDVRE